MTRALLIQAATGPCEPLLKMTVPRHAEWAARHGMDYERNYHRVSDRHPSWDKIAFILDGLKAGYEYVIWLDADTLVVDIDADPRDALESGKQLAMAYIPTIPFLQDKRGHWQAGAIYTRSGPEVIWFLERVWERGGRQDDMACWYEQAVINGLLQIVPSPEWCRMAGVEWGHPWMQRLEDRWNSTWCMNPCDDPVVLAWHGTHADKHERMKAALEAVNAGGCGVLA